jgi:hypothetical protein
VPVEADERVGAVARVLLVAVAVGEVEAGQELAHLLADPDAAEVAGAGAPRARAQALGPHPEADLILRHGEAAVGLDRDDAPARLPRADAAVRRRERAGVVALRERIGGPARLRLRADVEARIQFHLQRRHEERRVG